MVELAVEPESHGSPEEAVPAAGWFTIAADAVRVSAHTPPINSRNQRFPPCQPSRVMK
jgi:hypothetical protein